jgi:hypothetical protein
MHDESTIRSTTEARRFVVEVIATLVHVKGVAADRLLRPAGVREDLVRRFYRGAFCHRRLAAAHNLTCRPATGGCWTFHRTGVHRVA